MDHMAMVKICFLMLLCIRGVPALALEDTSSYTVGLLVQSSSQLTHLLQSSTTIAKMDISGYRFYKTTFSGIPVIMGYTGNDLINGALTTQLLITSFPSVTTVVNFGHSASPDVENINLGDIVMPTKLAHTGNWFWQNVGDTTTEGEASLTFSDCNSNLLCLLGTNKVWYQDSEVYDNSEGYDPYDTSSSVFWVNASTNITTPYVLLQSCADVNGIEECLAYTPKVVRTDAGCSADIYVSNAAYAEFLLSTFSCSTLDKDAASIGLVCLRNNVSFVALRSISNTAGIPSNYNEPKSELLHKLANYNSIAALQGVISQLSTPPLPPPISEPPPPPPSTPPPPHSPPPPPPISKPPPPPSPFPPPPPSSPPPPPPHSPSPPPPPISKPPPPPSPSPPPPSSPPPPPPPSPPPPPPPISKPPPPPSPPPPPPPPPSSPPPPPPSSPPPPPPPISKPPPPPSPPPPPPPPSPSPPPPPSSPPPPPPPPSPPPPPPPISKPPPPPSPPPPPPPSPSPPPPPPPISKPPPPPSPPPPPPPPSPPPPPPPPPPISKPPPPPSPPPPSPPPSSPPPPPPISKPPPPPSPPPPPPVLKPPPPPPPPSSESARSLSTRILCYVVTLSLSMYLLAIMV